MNGETIQEMDFAVDLLQVMLWGQNEAEILETLLRHKEDWYRINQSEFWANWYRDVFDIRTANRFGLSVWSIILDINLSVSLDPSAANKPAFGFGAYASTHNQNFGRGNFSSKSSSTAVLTVEQARLLLRLRYFQLIARPTVPHINRMLSMLFQDQGKAFVLDTHDMAYVIYVFDFEIGSQVKFLLDSYDILPRPAGVGVQYRVITRQVFGFGDFNTNFNHETFASEKL